jgi:hypothetical protein
MKPLPDPVGAEVGRRENESDLGTGDIEYFRRLVRYVASRAVLIFVADIHIDIRVGEHGGHANADSEPGQVRPIQVKIPEVRFYGFVAP